MATKKAEVVKKPAPETLLESLFPVSVSSPLDSGSGTCGRIQEQGGNHWERKGWTVNAHVNLIKRNFQQYYA